ncbi:IMV membrane protein, virion morphogenesis [Eptesipox virus]|uniref:IMV membrane protein, virion morphogenesis n=1 Tax=Eptesipox virus TaxID=1329402 RepID=A0A220T6D4_9POXV|nr:IMV membrane protein, virion morphogenesis [Eptesipox virus]ASK51270.1 IMV membrane protein, virion morphogenesis [Eptesipox virus]WAH71028.1 IMV membrane protein, virion morphogenesis [Eptesipox virus]
MDHDKYLLTMFFANDKSFFKYLSEQDDEIAMMDVSCIIEHLNFLLMLLIKSKEKLEAIGHCYEPLSEDFKSVMDFSSMTEMKQLLNKTPINVNDVSVKVDKGYLLDFVISMIRLKNSVDYKTPKHVTYIDPRHNQLLSNILKIINKSE